MGRPVKVLLDTHAFLWALAEPDKLSTQARALLSDEDTDVLVSSASAWEIATKYRLGKLPGATAIVTDYAAAMRGLKARDLPITRQHALLAGSYEQAHRDPFDRMLAAQAHSEGLPLLSGDPALRQFDVELVW